MKEKLESRINKNIYIYLCNFFCIQYTDLHLAEGAHSDLILINKSQGFIKNIINEKLTFSRHSCPLALGSSMTSIITEFG